VDFRDYRLGTEGCEEIILDGLEDRDAVLAVGSFDHKLPSEGI